MLGGGTWLTQNKVLPGTYINFVSKLRASVNMADRGYASMPLVLDWGPENEVFTVTAEDFQENCMKYFGYAYTSDEMKGLRDLFLNLKTGYFYRLSNEAVVATSSIAKAKYGGVRGNDITVAITANVDDNTKFDVKTYIDVDGTKTLIENQKAVSSWDDVDDNDYVTWIRTADIALNAGEALTGGSNGGDITGVQYQAYLDAIEPYYFNVMGYAGTDSTIQELLITFVKRMRDDVGAKFQLVLYNVENADYEGVISIKNKATDEGASPASLVYWLTGAEASCAVNASLTNTTYDGEYDVYVGYSQSELEQAIGAGMLTFHNVTYSNSGALVTNTNVLRDINTFISFTKRKTNDFAMNQVIRVLDQTAIDISRLFNKTYLGKEQNDSDGRTALWGDVVALFKEYMRIRAITEFTSDDVEIPTQGENKNDVVLNATIQPVVAMERLYTTITVA